jgi:hypothetical protein
MDTKLNTQKVAKEFWTKFMENESILYNNIKKRNIDEYNQSINIIDEIINSLNIKNMVNVHFGIDTRNGMVLPERKDNIELILSPIFQRNNQQLIIDLYNESFNYKLPNYWTVIKYKFHRSSQIHTIILNYDKKATLEIGDSAGEIIEISKDDFSYYPIINDKKTQLSILLFIKDDKSTYLIKKEKVTVKNIDREIWIPKDNGIHAILDSAIGEYNLLNTLDKMEIHLESDLKKEEFLNIDSIKIENIINDIHMINNNPLNTFNKCSRCEYSNKNIKLCICKCKNAYYCDTICQQAHRKLHKLNCCLI